MKPSGASPDQLPIILFEDQQAWADWLDLNHTTSSGLWLRIAKKVSGTASVSYAEALDVALCYGWIDGQKYGYDEGSWLQKFTPRRPKSIWSKINREKALALIESGRMQAAGLQEIERAKQDGRWDAAYDSQRNAELPADFQAELNKHPEASAFWATLNSRNRYPIVFRLQTAKKPETRAKRIAEFIAMLERHEKFYP